jgi:hypothetical protein
MFQEWSHSYGRTSDHMTALTAQGKCPAAGAGTS